MRNRAFRPIAAMLSVVLLAGGPVHAEPVAINQVIQVIGSYQNPPELRLRSLSQPGGTKSTDRQPTAQASDSLLWGVASSDPQRGVEIIDQGNVETTICDCGDIIVPDGGFPKWPLLFLAAIPFFFINSGDTPDVFDTPILLVTPTLLPAPSPTPVPTPEPGSLLLFGTALVVFGTSLRRRYKKSKQAGQVDSVEEGQSI